jgi:hypothetical protein
VTGRPSGFSPDIANAICERIANGESLRTICEEDGQPDKATVFRWLASNTEFRDQYAHAREMQAETYADEMVNIADAAKDANLARLQIDARKWKASKLAPKKYGDKVALTGGDEGDAPIKHVFAWQNEE